MVCVVASRGVLPPSMAMAGVGVKSLFRNKQSFSVKSRNESDCLMQFCSRQRLVGADP